jgi:lysozyme family protein
MTFDDAFEILIDHEKGFQNDPNDPGNWTGGKKGKGELRGTKYGVSAAAYPQVDIRNLTMEDAKAIYHRDYWSKVAKPFIPQNLHFNLFDIAVNSGPETAIRLLQRALGVTEDGDPGPKTQAALASVSAFRLSNRIHAYRLLYMTDLKNWTSSGKGWARRVAKNILEDNAA